MLPLTFSKWKIIIASLIYVYIFCSNYNQQIYEDGNLSNTDTHFKYIIYISNLIFSNYQDFKLFFTCCFLNLFQQNPENLMWLFKTKCVLNRWYYDKCKIKCGNFKTWAIK